MRSLPGGLIRFPRVLCGLAAASLALASCAHRPVSSPSSPAVSAKTAAVSIKPPSAAATQPVAYPGLRDVVTYYEGMICGAVPEGDEGFATLKKMGIKTIISVDGTKPEVELAKKYGLRYVHLPIGYNGMNEQRTLELARASHDLPGPIYLHCHHGKHRSACAAGAVGVTLGILTPEQALDKMKISGTAPSYKGLFEAVKVSRPELGALASASDEFPEISKTSQLVDSMVEIDQAHDNLQAIEKAGWKTPADHPDLVPAAEAGKMADLLRGLKDEDHVKARPGEFKNWLASESTRAGAIEEGLVSGVSSPAELSASFKQFSQSCIDCHAKYRNDQRP